MISEFKTSIHNVHWQTFYCLFVLSRSLPNGIYKLQNSNSHEEYDVYCHMTEISGCGGGGWTLVMKLDGNKVKVNSASRSSADTLTEFMDELAERNKNVIMI